jgi:uncharacterized lipoprotein YddW (UPF0748 family)
MPFLNRRQMLSLSGVASAGAVAAFSGCSTVLEPLGGVSLRPEPDLAALAPVAPREFRAAWVATVANIDWPSRKGLSTAAQQLEMRAMLDRAVTSRLNAIILQVRTSADALYASELEPWSEYLSGIQGQAPDPFYDPLALWIAEAHARGLELHAWFNPFRARQSKAASPAASSHLSQTRPQWVKSYGDQLWIDPGEPGAGDHSLAVFMDVLQRYDVDGIHIDDYFYPYPVTQAGQGESPKTEVDFPDEPSWQRYQAAGGILSRDDWRRSNVDALVERIYRGIRQTKPWVRFGISPFGLGRPELRPPEIRGFSQYHKLYANVEHWVAEGWFDYLVPQLYWTIATKEQAFAPLLNYWHQQNTQNRHVWAGLFTSRVAAENATPNPPASWAPQEIVNQIALVRERAPGTGHVHFSMVALMGNRQGLGDQLQAGLYAQPALVPASPWLPANRLGSFGAELKSLREGGYQLQLHAETTGATALRWVIWLRYGTRWELHTAGQTELELLERSADGDLLNALVVSTLDRVGNEGLRQGYRVLENIL